jgi:hypothetical protein
VQTQEANVANIYYEITANDEEIPTDLTFTIVDEDTGDEVYTGKTENGIINVSNIPFGNYSIKVDNYKEIKVNVDKQYLEKQHILKQADLKEVAIGEKSFLVKIPQEESGNILYINIYVNYVVICIAILIVLIETIILIKLKRGEKYEKK